VINTGMSRRGSAAVTAALAAGATAMMAGLGAAPAIAAGLRADASAHAAVQAHQPRVKYYVVPPATDGHREFLYQIAAQVLGNGRLYGEIFRLNQGRVQPDGGQLETPASIDPGWILILPPDAAGPGVHFGVPPGAQATSAGRADAGGTGPGRANVVRSILLAVTVIMLIAIAGIVSRRRRKSGRPDGQALTRPAAAAQAARPAPFRPGLLAATEARRPVADHRLASGPAASDAIAPLTLADAALPGGPKEEDGDLPWPDYLS
jgi:hypothetical protein